MTDTLLIPRAIQQEHYNASLGAALRAPIIWDTDEVLSQDPTAYEKLRHDTVIAQLVQQRKHEVAGTDWYLEPASSSKADKKVAQVVERLLKKCTNFEQARFRLAEAILRGAAWEGMRGQFVKFAATDGDEPRRWWVVHELASIDKRRFRQVPLHVPGDQGAEPQYGWELKRPYTYTWEPLEPGWYVHHTYGDEEASLHYGKGLSNALSQYWWYKAETLKLAMKWLDRWALGVLAAKITLDEGARRDPTNAQRVNSWLTTLKKMREGYALVYDQRDVLELKEASGTGFEAITRMLDYYDGAFRVLLLGASDPSNPDTSGGSYARAKVQAAKSRALIRFDRALLESTITRDLVATLVRANWPTFLRLGLVPSDVPAFKIRGEDEEDDPLVRMQVAQLCLALGMPLKVEELYAQAKFTPPAADDKVLGGQQQAQAPDVGAALQQLLRGQREGQQQPLLNEQRRAVRYGFAPGGGQAYDPLLGRGAGRLVQPVELPPAVLAALAGSRA